MLDGLTKHRRTEKVRVSFYIDREVKITTFAGFAQCANPAEAKFAHSAAEIDDVDLWAALELLDLPPPPWAAVRQPARARLAAAGAAQTTITLQASSMARVPHRMGGIAAARGRGSPWRRFGGSEAWHG